MTGAECSLRQESGPQSRFLTRLAGPKYLGHLMLLLKHLAKKQDQQLSCKPGPAAAKQQLKLLHHSVGLMNIFYWIAWKILYCEICEGGIFKAKLVGNYLKIHVIQKK